MLPEILVLYCGRAVGDGVNPPDSRMADDFKARFVRMPCSSKITSLELLKLFENGADGIIVVACAREGCQFLFGDSCAEQRVKYARALLEEIGLGAGRLSLASGSNISESDLVSLVDKNAAVICGLGVNPLKKSLVAP